MDVFILGAWRTPTSGEVYIGGTWRRLSYGEIYSGGQWRTIVRFTPAMSVTVSPSTASGTANPPSPRTQAVGTGNVTATPQGGLPPYSYAWSITSPANVLSPAMATTSFRASVPAESTANRTATVIVTDALGATASASLPVSFNNYSIS